MLVDWGRTIDTLQSSNNRKGRQVSTQRKRDTGKQSTTRSMLAVKFGAMLLSTRYVTW